MTTAIALQQLAASPNIADRQQVAANPAAPPELLYYLAGDTAVEVRQAAAENALTPLQAAPKLQQDPEWQVRAALARKIGRALATLPSGPNQQQAFVVLEKLCADTQMEVRRAVATTLQDTAFLPPKLALQLASDAERAVASPILRFCLTLRDEDLAKLILSSTHPWVPVEAAHRQNMTNEIAAAIWETGNMEAAALLLANQTTKLDNALVDDAVEVSSSEVSLQSPLVSLPQLNATQLLRLAEFVDGSLLETLSARAALEAGDTADVSRIVGRRLEWAATRKKGGSGAERAKQLHQQNQLDDVAVSDAIAAGEADFVATALALRAKVDFAIVQKILAHQSPKGITALCWRAGLAMRTCRQLQVRIAHIPARKALLAREGFFYPLPDADFIRQLEFYGINQS